MTDYEMKYAFRKAVSSEFDGINNEEKIAFSEKFEKKMGRLIRSEKRAQKDIPKPVKIRLAVSFAALIFTLTTALTATAAINEEPYIIEFSSSTGEYIQIVNPSTESIKIAFRLLSVPDGFYAESHAISNTSAETVYENTAGEKIRLRQYAANSVVFPVEKGYKSSKNQNGLKSTRFYLSDNGKAAYWIQDGYLTELIYEGEISQSDFEKLTEKVGI